MRKRKCSKRKATPECTSERDEMVKILVNSGISKLDNIIMTFGKKPWAARMQEGRGMSLANASETSGDANSVKIYKRMQLWRGF